MAQNFPPGQSLLQPCTFTPTHTTLQLPHTLYVCCHAPQPGRVSGARASPHRIPVQPTGSGRNLQSDPVSVGIAGFRVCCTCCRDPESRQMPRDKGAPMTTGGTRQSRRTHYMASLRCGAPCSEVVPSQSFSPLSTLTTQRRGHGRHHPRWTEGKQSTIPQSAEVPSDRAFKPPPPHLNRQLLPCGHPIQRAL